jgi:hypothetical protein
MTFMLITEHTFRTNIHTIAVETKVNNLLTMHLTHMKCLIVWSLYLLTIMRF